MPKSRDQMSLFTPVKLVPVIVTNIPTEPLVGLKPVIDGVTVKLPELVTVPRCDDDVACSCDVGHDSRHLACPSSPPSLPPRRSDAFVPTVLPAPIRGEGVNEKFAVNRT